MLPYIQISLCLYMLYILVSAPKPSVATQFFVPKAILSTSCINRTPFHADVLRSYSWSANIKGRKVWTLYPPGAEDLLRDKYGNLPFDVNSSIYRDLSHPSFKYRQEVIQEKGQIIFVPSGWHHQVINLEETLSVNHNWFNGCNIRWCWNYLCSSLKKVEKEISDCMDMDGWGEHCQVLLRAYIGFNYEDFINILGYITHKRLSNESTVHTKFDILMLVQLLEDINQSSTIDNKNHKLCTNILASLHGCTNKENS